MASSNPPRPASPDAEIENLREIVRDLQARVTALERSSSSSAAPEPDREPAREGTESRFGLTIVNRIGAMTLAIGMLFFFKYAVDNQWIGAATRVLLGVIAGAVLIGIAEWLRRREQSAFAQGLAGCGVMTLYVSGYAAFAYYQLVPRPVGFVAMFAACVVGVALAMRYGSSALGGLGLIGALLAPVLLRDPKDAAYRWVFFGYLLLLSFVAGRAAHRLYARIAQKGALVLIVFNAGFALLSAAILFYKHAGVFNWFAFVLAMLYFGSSFASREIRNLFRAFYATAHAALTICFLSVVESWSARISGEANRSSAVSELDSVLLAVYGVVLIAVGVGRRSVINRLIGLTLIGIVVAKLYLYDVWLLARFYRISAFVALGVILLAASYIYSRLRGSAGSA
jgi:uncharacterized membrane protein